MAPMVTTMPRNVAIGVISLTRRSPREAARRLDFDAIEPSTAASVDTSRDGARACVEERESTESTERESTGSAARMARMVHESTRMQSADDSGEVGIIKLRLGSGEARWEESSRFCAVKLSRTFSE